MIPVTLEFTIPGKPGHKSRVKVNHKTGVSYTPENTKIFENLVKMTFAEHFPNHAPITRPLSVMVTAYFPIPKSWSKKKQAMALDGTLGMTQLPDGDNTLKAILDGLNTVAWADDRQIVFMSIKKDYSLIPRTEVRIDYAIDE